LAALTACPEFTVAFTMYINVMEWPTASTVPTNINVVRFSFHYSIFSCNLLTFRWLSGVVVRTEYMPDESRYFCVSGSSPDHDTAWLFLT